MKKRGDDDPKQPRSPTKRTAPKRARILRKPKNPEVGYGRPSTSSSRVRVAIQKADRRDAKAKRKCSRKFSIAKSLLEAPRGRAR